MYLLKSLTLQVSMNTTFGAATTTNPRPFKCDDCKIAFRIHGHLAKHLRSKMHIMKLECIGKLPFGTYAELERSGFNLNEIDTTDCDNSLESLQVCIIFFRLFFASFVACIASENSLKYYTRSGWA